MSLPEATSQPCRECPWRRKAAAGWLGPYDAEQWLLLVNSDAPIACHLTIPDEAEDEDPETWNDHKIKQCAGAAQYRKNVAKMPRDKEIALAAERDTTEVFATPVEFKDHHNRK